MLKFLLAFSLVLSACMSTPPTRVERVDFSTFGFQDRKEMAEANRRSVKIEWVCNMAHRGIIGSGVVIGHKEGKTLVATAAHVVDHIDKKDCEVVVYDWTGASGFGEVLKSNEDYDIATVEVSEILGEVAPLESNPYLGQPVTCVGWPDIPKSDYEGQSITRGNVSTILGDFIRVSADLYFGNSGGSCFSKDGKVVGIISNFTIGGFFFGNTVPFPGQYFIAHADNLKKLLD